MEFIKSEYANGFGIMINNETGEVSISFIKEEPIIDVDKMMNGESAEIIKTEVAKIILQKGIAENLSKAILETVNYDPSDDLK